MQCTDRFIADVVLSNTKSGLVGEYIAAAAVLCRGWRVAMAQQDSVDLVAWHPNTSAVLRIQVKSCQASRQIEGGRVRNRVHFQTGLGGKKRLPTEADYDILACVSSEQRTVWFIPIGSVTNKKIKRHTDFFDDPDLERDSWAKCLEVLGVDDGS
jgi:hypothetical protein